MQSLVCISSAPRLLLPRWTTVLISLRRTPYLNRYHLYQFRYELFGSTS